MEVPSPLDAGDSQFTTSLRLEPIGPANAHDLWLVHNDDEVAPWYDNEKPSLDQAERWAESIAHSWRLHGVHKWIACDRASGELVGRGGLSRTPVDDDWGQIYPFLPAEPWVRAAHESHQPFVAHAGWLEIGWALRREFWGRGYAAEIGRAGLAFAFDVLKVQAVVSCTIRHNVRSRAVMERIGMRYAGEIRSRGTVEGVEGVQDDAPFAVCVLLRSDWARPGKTSRASDELLNVELSYLSSSAGAAARRRLTQGRELSPMTDGEYQPVAVSRRICAPAHDIFQVLADPARHSEIDGSQSLRGAGSTGVISVGWEPEAGRGHPNAAAEGSDSSRWGHRWSYQLTPDGPDATVVTEIYDCSRAPEDERAQMDNGNVWAQSMAETLERLDALCTRQSRS
ncbi:MAG TPA: GNAT family N-acetyltransferase [Streptosporangiaceae bacterium]